nr:hypothetical protein CFP56_58160 [Quercus suber]
MSNPCPWIRVISSMPRHGAGTQRASQLDQASVEVMMSEHHGMSADTSPVRGTTASLAIDVSHTLPSIRETGSCRGSAASRPDESYCSHHHSSIIQHLMPNFLVLGGSRIFIHSQENRISIGQKFEPSHHKENRSFVNTMYRQELMYTLRPAKVNWRVDVAFISSG